MRTPTVSWVVLLLLTLFQSALPYEFDFFDRLSARDDTCQTSLQAYTELHAKMSQGALPARFVHVHCGSGLADMLKGIVSAFHYGLLSGRALKISIPAFEATFKSSLDLFSPPFSRSSFLSGVPKGESAVFHAVQFAFSLRGPPLFDAFIRGNVSGFLAEYNHVFLENCFIMPLDRLLDDETSVHGQQLRGLGFNADNIFRCSLNYLLRPRREIFYGYRPLFAAYLAKLQPIRLFGVHVRVGDAAFMCKQGSCSFPVVQVDKYIAYMRYVDREEQAKAGGQAGVKVLFVLSDSPQTREYVKSKWASGDVITNTAAKVRHVSKYVASEEQRVDAMHLAVAELLLLSASDTLLVSKGNFGLAASLLSPRAPATYRCVGSKPRWPIASSVMNKIVKYFTENVSNSGELRCGKVTVRLSSLYSSEMKAYLPKYAA